MEKILEELCLRNFEEKARKKNEEFREINDTQDCDTVENFVDGMKFGAKLMLEMLAG